MIDVKTIGVFTIGMTASYFWAEFIFKRKYQRIADEEIQAVKAHYAKKNQRDILEAKKVLEDLDREKRTKVTAKDRDPSKYSVAESLKGDTPEDMKNTVEKLGYAVKSSISYEELQIAAEKQKAKIEYESVTVTTSPDKTKPYLVTFEQYEMENEDFDKVVLSYYDADDVLTDDRDIPVETRDYIGPESLDSFDDDRLETIYVRNEKIKTDFEITRIKGSFARIVWGELPEDETAPLVRKMRDDADDD